MLSEITVEAAGRYSGVLVGDNIYFPRISYLDVIDTTTNIATTKSLSLLPKRCAAHYDGKLYMPVFNEATLEIYDIAGDSYVQKTIPSAQRNYCCYYDGKIYLPRSGSPYMDIYNISTEAVTQADFSWSVRRCGVLVDTKIYLPRDAEGYLDIYNLANDTYTSVAIANSGRYSCCHAEGKIYITRRNETTMDVYTISNGNISGVAIASNIRYSCQYTHGRVYLPRSGEDVLDIYKIADGSFLSKTIENDTRTSSGMTVDSGKLYLPRSPTSDVLDLYYRLFVTYNANGATSGDVPTDDEDYDETESVVSKANTGSLAYTSHKLLGWNTQADGLGTHYDLSETFAMPSSNLILYADWEAAKSITYNGNGNTAGTVPTDANEYYNGDTATTLTNSGNLLRTGKLFIGWNTLANGAGTHYDVSASISMAASNIVLYADWERVYYTLTYDGNGNTGGTVPIDAVTHEYQDTVTLKTNSGTLVKTGYGFAGWNTQANGAGTHYAVSASYTMPAANTTLYAEWSVAYQITYDGNGSDGGDVPVDSTDYISGQSATVLANTGALTRIGYVLLTWNTQADGEGTSYAFGATLVMTAADVILYATWTDGGSVMALITLAQYKTLMGVTSTDATRDARIVAMIPQIESDIVEICNNDFTNEDIAFSGSFVPNGTGTTYTLTCALGGISAVSFTAGDIILLEGTVRNDNRYTTTTITDTVVTVSEQIVTEAAVSATITVVQWPQGLRMYAARMIAYQLAHMDDAGITHESIKSYSYTRAGGGAADAGYPQEIIAGMRRSWGNVKTGRGQRIEQYNDKRGTWTGAIL